MSQPTPAGTASQGHQFIIAVSGLTLTQSQVDTLGLAISAAAADALAAAGQGPFVPSEIDSPQAVGAPLTAGRILSPYLLPTD